MYNEIQVGDTVYFSTPHSLQLKGRAVMKGPAGWVLNCGGRYGTPQVVSENNFIKLRKGRNRRPDYLGEFLNN
jgi:hypothetical protein